MAVHGGGLEWQRNLSQWQRWWGHNVMQILKWFPGVNVGGRLSGCTLGRLMTWFVTAASRCHQYSSRRTGEEQVPLVKNDLKTARSEVNILIKQAWTLQHCESSIWFVNIWSEKGQIRFSLLIIDRKCGSSTKALNHSPPVFKNRGSFCQHNKVNWKLFVASYILLRGAIHHLTALYIANAIYIAAESYDTREQIV